MPCSTSSATCGRSDIYTPGSIGYELRYAQQQKLPDGGREIILATDQPMSFWEIVNSPRSAQYPFTWVQFKMKPDGNGDGKLAVAARIDGEEADQLIEVEDFRDIPGSAAEHSIDKGPQLNARDTEVTERNGDHREIVFSVSSAILCALRVQTVTGVSEIVVSPSATFAFVWLTRRAATDVAATAMLFGIEVAALALGTVAAWLGGELVDRLGVGVDEGANLNAASSLSGRSARPA